MRFTMLRSTLTGFVKMALVGAALLPASALAQTAPDGWTTTQPAPGVVAFTPPDLAPSEIFRVAVSDPQPLDGRSLTDWLADAMRTDPLRHAGVAKLINSNAVPVYQVQYLLPGGPAADLYTAARLDNGTVRMLHITLSPLNRIYQRYRTQVDGVVQAVKRSGSAEPPRHLSPDAAQTTAAQEADAKRYKWVTPPGRGLKPAQVAGIWRFYHVKIDAGFYGLTTIVVDHAYLLLPDGTLHRGLSVPPDQMDVARSRRMEPNAWGRWKRDGGKMLASWGGEPLRPLPGAMALPARPGQRLTGHWGTGSSSADIGGSSHRLWGVAFTPKGRFTKDGSGGSSNSLFAQTGGQPAINSTYNNEESGTSVVGGGVTAVTSRRRNPNGDREGTYVLDGYTLTLRYDDGRVERMPFFFADAAHKQLFFEGDTLGYDTDDK